MTLYPVYQIFRRHTNLPPCEAVFLSPRNKCLSRYAANIRRFRGINSQTNQSQTFDPVFCFQSSDRSVPVYYIFRLYINLHPCKLVFRSIWRLIGINKQSKISNAASVKSRTESDCHSVLSIGFQSSDRSVPIYRILRQHIYPAAL